MKKVLYTLVISAGILFLYSCGDDNPAEPNPPGGGGSNTYFPGSDGNYYKYSVTSTDSANNQVQGTRSAVYTGSQVIEGISYQVQVDTFILGSQPAVTNSFFRKTDTGVFYFLDTTGLSANIPDSLMQYINLDAEARAFLFPLNNNSSWTVFSLNLNYGVLNFPVVLVTAAYAGNESVTLNLLSGAQTFEAIKIRYRMTLKFDFSSPSSNYEAFCWLADSIGAVKWEGNATLLNGLSGTGIDFDDTTRVVTQSLIQYDIK